MMIFNLILLVVVVILWNRVKYLEHDLHVLKNQLAQLNPGKRNPKAVSEYVEPLESDASLPPTTEAVFPILERIKPEAVNPQLKPEKNPDYEKQLAVKFSVWVGAIALAMGGFYLAQYSIQNDLMSPLVRIILGLVLGALLIYAGLWVHYKQNINNGRRISQALTGAGLADLYVCLYASGAMYHLVPELVALMGIALLTLATVVLALRQGMPIALIGLIGGFLMPALFSFHSFTAPVFFSYLYFLLIAILYIARRKGWWILSLLTLIATFAWVGGWVWLLPLVMFDTHVIAVFLLLAGLSASGLFWQQLRPSTPQNPYALLSIYVAVGVPALLMCVLQTYSHFMLLEWGIVALLAMASLVLAYFDQAHYGFAPWVTLIIVLVLFVGADNSRPLVYGAMAGVFVLIYGVGGYCAQWQAPRPLLFAVLVSVSSIAFYLISYWQLHLLYSPIDLPTVFSLIALILAVIYTYIAYQIMDYWPKESPYQQHLLANYAAAVTAFVALAISVLCPGTFLPLAFSLQFLALSWIRTKVNIKAMTYLALLVATVPVYYLLPQLLILLGDTTYLVFMRNENIAIAMNPLIQLAIPSVCFAGASYYFRQNHDDEGWSLRLEAAAFIGFTALVYILIRVAFHPDANLFQHYPSFFERATINNGLVVFALLTLGIGHYAQRSVLMDGAALLFGYVLVRILMIDVLLSNPVQSGDPVGDYPVFNLLTWAYLMPPVLFYAGHKLIVARSETISSFFDVAELILIFVWLTLSIRQGFHGSVLLYASPLNHAEIIAYSVGWMIFGIALIFYGTLKKIKALRLAGLAIIMLTVGKVFLYDAASLEGLLRVLSFLGLGICLIGIGWFSSRFVFFNEDQE